MAHAKPHTKQTLVVVLWSPCIIISKVEYQCVLAHEKALRSPPPSLRDHGESNGHFWHSFSFILRSRSSNESFLLLGCETECAYEADWWAATEPSVFFFLLYSYVNNNQNYAGISFEPTQIHVGCFAKCTTAAKAYVVHIYRCIAGAIVNGSVRIVCTLERNETEFHAGKQYK